VQVDTADQDLLHGTHQKDSVNVLWGLFITCHYLLGAENLGIMGNSWTKLIAVVWHLSDERGICASWMDALLYSSLSTLCCHHRRKVVTVFEEHKPPPMLLVFYKTQMLQANLD